MKFKGIIPPVITPYNGDGSINEKEYAVMLEHLIDSGVHGIIVGGTTGEYYSQSKEERFYLTKVAKKVINKRVPLIVGIGAIRTEDCIEYGVEARKVGADAVLMGAPYYAVPTQLELAKHALAIDRAVDLPIILYNYPGRTGTTMQSEFFDRVGRSANFCAIKESTGDINQLHMLARNYPHIDILCGMDDQALEFFAWGAKGWVCGGGNCLPKEHIALYQACVIEKDYDKGRRIMSALMPFMHTLEQGGKFIQTIKYGCELVGLPANGLRSPLGPLNKEQKREVSMVLNSLKPTVAAIVGA
jgi:4-hydroxy-tetrahydrodipicolinate synthase